MTSGIQKTSWLFLSSLSALRAVSPPSFCPSSSPSFLCLCRSLSHSLSPSQSLPFSFSLTLLLSFPLIYSLFLSLPHSLSPSSCLSHSVLLFAPYSVSFSHSPFPHSLPPSQYPVLLWQNCPATSSGCLTVLRGSELPLTGSFHFKFSVPRQSAGVGQTTTTPSPPTA